MLLSFVALVCFLRRVMVHAGMTSHTLPLGTRVEPMAMLFAIAATWLASPICDNYFAIVLITPLAIELAERVEEQLQLWLSSGAAAYATTDGALVGLCLTIIMGNLHDVFVVLSFRAFELLSLTVVRALSPVDI